MQVRASQKRTGLDHLEVPEKEGMPRALPQARREQRLKEGLEEVSGIRGARLPTPAPRREVSPGRSSSRRMYHSPTESSDEEYDSYAKAGRGRRAEGRSSSPRPRKSDEWRGWDKRDRPERGRDDSPEEGEPPSSRSNSPHHLERETKRSGLGPKVQKGGGGVSHNRVSATIWQRVLYKMYQSFK
jgi:hypothetical protein